MTNFRKFGSVCAVAALVLTSGCRQMDDETEATLLGAAGAINPVIDTCNITKSPKPGTPVTTEMANSGLPCAVTFNQGNELADLQLDFDFNSWLTFVALHEDDGGMAMWQGWQDMGSLMLPDGKTPPPFGQSVPAPEICTGGADGAPVLTMISKTPTTPTASISGEPLNTGPLIDQNGNYARYQILVNEVMYDYIVDNKLYSKAGQAAFDKDIVFPEGNVTKDTTGTMGAIVLKVSWKVLAGDDDPADFHSVKGYVYSPATADTPESCVTETLGLVGMHIVHKTKQEPQWLWGTFEHKDNAPDSPTSTGSFHFYDPSCTDCEVNAEAPQPWNPAVEPFPGNFRSQIVRTTTYPSEAVDSAARWNPEFQQALKGTALANYRLVTTQWPTDGSSTTDPMGAPFPLFAANTTMETYVQATRSGDGWVNTPQATSSCMSCHNNATTTNGKESDFSFVLEKAE